MISWSDVKDIFDIVQSAATVIALAIGGIWTYGLFVRKREKYPRAAIEHRISYRPIIVGKMLLSVDILVSNKSDVLLSLESGRISVRQVLPPSAELGDILKTGQGSEVTDWQLLVPLKNLGWQKGDFEIEPEESQQLSYHFVIDASIQTILISSYFRNTSKSGHMLAWDSSTIHDLH